MKPNISVKADVVSLEVTGKFGTLANRWDATGVTWDTVGLNWDAGTDTIPTPGLGVTTTKINLTVCQ